MARLERTLTIHAAVEKVFSYAVEPKNLPEFWPSIIEVKDVEPLPTGGYKFRWVYTMAGIRGEGASETIEFVANQRSVVVSKGTFASTIAWTYQSNKGDTELTFVADYALNVPVLRKLAEPFLVRLNENEADLLLANLKAKMES